MHTDTANTLKKVTMAIVRPLPLKTRGSAGNISIINRSD